MRLLATFFILSLLVFQLFAFAGPLHAQSAGSSATSSSSFGDKACQGAKGTTGSADCKGNSFATGLKNVINIIIFLVGAAAVIMVIIGGFRYVVSGGDSAGVEGAKNTILYAVVGIIVALLSYAIVNFVLLSVKTTGGSGSGSGTPSLSPPTSGP